MIRPSAKALKPSKWDALVTAWGASLSLATALFGYSALKVRDAGSPAFDTEFLTIEKARSALYEWEQRCSDIAQCLDPGEYAFYALVWDTLFPLACAAFAFFFIAIAWRSFTPLPRPVERVEPVVWISAVIALALAVGADLTENLASTLIVTDTVTGQSVFAALVIGNNFKWIAWIVIVSFAVAAVTRLFVINIGLLFHLRFPLLVLGAGMVASLSVPQVTELYTLADENKQLFGLWATSLALATAVWYSARTVLRYRLSEWRRARRSSKPETEKEKEEKRKKEEEEVNAFRDATLRLKIWTPRLLGTGVLVIVAVAYPGNSEWLWITAILFAAIVTLRRHMSGMQPLTPEGAHEYLELEPWNFSEISKPAKVMLAIALVANIAIIAWAAADPAFLQPLGAVAIVMLAGVFFVITGSMLALLGGWLRIPFISILVIGAAVMQWYGVTDNHFVRQCPEASSRSRSEAMCPESETLQPVSMNIVKQRIDELQGKPIVIVSAAGGGIRAAAWTALVLGTLQDHAPLNAHLFAASGVSGGSLGLAVYASSLADGVPA